MKTTEVILINEVNTGLKDKTNRPIVTEKETVVSDVLFAPVSADDVINTLNLTGKKAVMQLAIPKGDTHTWENAKVIINGKKYRTIGIPDEGMDENIPLKWNKKIKVELYE